jgi:hypothetical protein
VAQYAAKRQLVGCPNGRNADAQFAAFQRLFEVRAKIAAFDEMKRQRRPSPSEKPQS